MDRPRRAKAPGIFEVGVGPVCQTGLWSLYISNIADVGQRSNKGTESSPCRVAVWMGRAFNPQEHCRFHTWGVAPVWYGPDLRPSEDDANSKSPSQRATNSAEGASHNSLGQRPRNCRNEKRTRAVGPFHHSRCMNSRSGLTDRTYRTYSASILQARQAGA